MLSDIGISGSLKRSIPEVDMVVLKLGPAGVVDKPHSTPHLVHVGHISAGAISIPVHPPVPPAI